MPVLDLSEMFSQAKPKPTRIPEAAVADLRILFDEYRAFLEACPFEAGNLVTPKSGYGMKGAGEPHVVLETVSRPTLDFAGEPSSTEHGCRPDMRIAKFSGDQRVVYWVESFAFEGWTPPDAPDPESSFRLPESYDPSKIDDVKMAAVTFLGAGEAHFGTIVDAIEAGTMGLADALRTLVYAGDVAHRRGDDGRDYYRIAKGEAV